MSTTNWPITDSEITLTGAYTCTHHNDAERGRCGRVCPVCITSERDKLRAEVERLKKRIKDDSRKYGCELLDPNGTIWEQAANDHARAERAEAEVERLRSDRDCEKRLRKDADEFRENAIERAMKAEADASTYLQRANSFRKLSDEAEAECLEQARLLGKSAEREADLLGKAERLERESKRLRTALAFISATLSEDSDTL